MAERTEAEAATAASVTPTSPPRAPLAFRVGIVGHRPNRLPAEAAGLEAIEAQVRAVLKAADGAVRNFALNGAELYFDGPPRLLAISPLAEGSDRMLARAALDLDYALCVPLPFPKAEFEKDFGAPDSAANAEFNDLLNRAAARDSLTCFELDGDRNDDAAAYGAAGRIVLNQSDLLIAVWDGERPRGGGGTVETLEEAILYKVPVIWIDAKPPYRWMLLRTMPDLGKEAVGIRPGNDIGELEEAVRMLVDAELSLPQENDELLVGHQHDASLAWAYFMERRPRINWHFGWKLFRNLIAGDGPLLPRLKVGDFVGEAMPGEENPRDLELISHFAWADKLADFNADAHRSGVIATSILSVTAVLLGVLPAALHVEGHHSRFEIATIICEGLVVLALSMTLMRARHRRYHDKWLEYRMLAEWIRQIRFLVPLGGGRPLLRTRAHLSVYGEPTQSWMYWHVRAIARARALPAAVGDRGHIARCLEGVVEMIGDVDRGQIGFHTVTMHRSERIQHRLHRITAWTVRVIFVAVLIHLAIAARGIEIIGRWEIVIGALLLLFSMVLPALGASIANINNQGEFSRLGKRARAMRDSFLRLKEEADTMTARLRDGGRNVTMAEVTSLASRMAATMLDEVIDWRVVVIDLPQGLE